MPPQRLVAPIVFALGVLSVSLWMLRYSEESALLYDGHGYYDSARAVFEGTADRLLRQQGQGAFKDIGYSNLLSLWFWIAGTSVRASQFLNALLWGLTALLLQAISRRWLNPRQAFVFGCLVAFSPMISSFSPKIYSETCALFGGVLSLWGWFALRDRTTGATGAWAGGFALLVLTKSAFFPLLLLLTFGLLIRRYWRAALPMALVLVLCYPVQKAIQGGGRGIYAVAGQVARMELWPASVVARCGVYSLSWQLGARLFPEVAGACAPFEGQVDLTQPRIGAEMNAMPWIRREIGRGFDYKAGLTAILSRPFKYLAVSFVNLLGAVWLDGVFPSATDGWPQGVKVMLWVFLKVMLSTVLWGMAIAVCASVWKQRQRWSLVLPLVLPIAYILVFHMNLLGEQRYFLPILPLLYLLASQGVVWLLSRRDLVPKKGRLRS